MLVCILKQRVWCPALASHPELSVESATTLSKVNVALVVKQPLKPWPLAESNLSSSWVPSGSPYSYRFPFNLRALSFIYFHVCTRRECFSLCTLNHLDLEGLSYFYSGRESAF